MHKFLILATILILIPLQILCNSTEYSNGENATNVYQFYKKIDELLTPSDENPLEGIQFLNENTLEFFKMVGPFASIIRKITENENSTEFESNDEKQKAFEIAKNFTEEHFMPLHDKYIKIARQDGMLMSDYYNSIMEPLESLASDLERMIALHGYEVEKENFKRKCLEQNPKFIISALKNRLKGFCERHPQQWQEEIEIYALATAVLDPLDKYAKEFLHRYDLYWMIRTRFMYKLTWMKMDEAKKPLVLLNNTINDYFYCRRRKECGHINAMGLIIGSSVDLITFDDWWNMRIDTYCLPKAILHYNDYKRKPLYDMAKIFTIGIVRALMTERICLELRHKGELRFNEFKHELIIRYTKEITAQTQQWIEYHLNNSWPSIPRAMAIRIAKSADLSNINNWNETASKISTELNEIGPPGFIHRTIITEPWNEREWYSAIYNTNNVIEINDIDLPVKLIIIRFKKTENWIENGTNFTKKLITEKREIGIKILSENWKSKDMDSLLANFLNATGLYGSNHFRGVLLLHNSKLFPFSCKIRSAFSTNKSENKEDDIELLQFHKNGFPKCDIFNIFLIM